MQRRKKKKVPKPSAGAPGTPAAAGGRRGDRGERRDGPARSCRHPWREGGVVVVVGWSHTHPPQGIGGGERGAEQKEKLPRGQRRAGTVRLPWRDQPRRDGWGGLRPNPPLGAIPAAGRARPAGSQRPAALRVPAVRPRCSVRRPAIPGALRAGQPSSPRRSSTVPGAPRGCVQFASLLTELPVGTAVTSTAPAVGLGSPHRALRRGSCPSGPPRRRCRGVAGAAPARRRPAAGATAGLGRSL